jgi:protein O-mannosyl-transferase
LSVRPVLRTALVCSVLFAGTVLIFRRALGYDFLNYDDVSYITGNASVQAGLTWKSIVWAFTAPNDYWHPLTWLSHMLDWQLYGADASGHHLTSAWWHATNAVLLFVVLRKFTGRFWLSAFGAALFAWHPLRVESVVWITERKDTMSGCFFLLTLLAYWVYAERQGKGRPAAGLYALTLLLFAAGLMCKPMLVSLPLVLVALDFWPLGRLASTSENCPGRWRSVLWEKIPFFALAAAVSVLTVRMQSGSGAFTLKLPLAARLGNAVVSVVRYLGKFVYPVDLAVCYPHPGYWPAWMVIGAILLVGGISTMAWRQRVIRPWLLTGWLWYLAMLLPVIGIVQVGFQAMADRYTYLPLLGIEVALLCAVKNIRLSSAGRWLAGALGAAVLAGCAMLTWVQQGVWRDTRTLFAHAVAVTGPNPVGEALLGYTLFNLGERDGAEQHSRRALELDSANTTAISTLARVREIQGQTDEAEAGYRRAFALNPRDAQTALQLGLLLLRRDRPDLAEPFLKSAVTLQPGLADENLRLAVAARQRGIAGEGLVRFWAATLMNPGDVSARSEWGFALVQLGRVAEGRARLGESASQQTEDAALHAGLGVLLLKRNLPEEAVLHFRTALESQPSMPVALVGLARAESQLGRYAEAAPIFARAVAQRPDDSSLSRAYAETLARLGQFSEAARYYRRTIELDPGDANAHAGLGYILYLTGDHATARVEWEAALRINPNFPGLRQRLQQSESFR